MFWFIIPKLILFFEEKELPKISLSDYLSKIDVLISENSYEQALYHAFYILRQFPKYFEIYKRIGRAYLEQNNLDGAANIYARLISAEPENFLNHLTLGLIMEMRAEADQAIYQTRCALFLQPENKEVIRLYQQLTTQKSGWREPPYFKAILTALRAFRQTNFESCILTLTDTDLGDYAFFGTFFKALSYAKLNDYANFQALSEGLLRESPYLSLILQELQPFLKVQNPLREREIRSRLTSLYPEISFSGNTADSSRHPIELIYQDWTGFQNSKLRSVWHQPGSKIINNQIDSLPEWLDCLPICDKLLFPRNNPNSGNQTNGIGFKTAAERKTRLKDEDIFFQKDYFRSQVVDKPVPQAAPKEEPASHPQSLIENDSSAELEEAFGLLEQMMNGTDEPLKTEKIADDSQPKAAQPAEEQPEEAANPEDDERIRAAWNCFSAGNPEEGIARYRELIADGKNDKKIKDDLRKLIILFPEYDTLKELL